MLFNRTAALRVLSRAGGTTLPRGGAALQAGGVRLPSSPGTKLPGSATSRFYQSIADPIMRATIRSLISDTSTSAAPTLLLMRTLKVNLEWLECNMCLQ